MSQAQGVPPGYQASPGYTQQPGYAPQPSYGTNVVVTQPQQHVVAVGNCPRCTTGHVSENFTALGIVLAILFFPIGILCCLLLVEKKCDRCGAAF